MFDLFRLWLGAVLRLFRTRRSLMLENVALRQQLAVFKRQQPRPRLGAIDKLFWVVARRFWAHWKKALVWSIISNALKRLGFRSHNFLTQLLSETSTACTIRVRRSTLERLWNDLGSHAGLHHRNRRPGTSTEERISGRREPDPESRPRPSRILCWVGIASCKPRLFKPIEFLDLTGND
jgi:hypothetical protein